MNLALYVLIYNYLNHQIDVFSLALMSNVVRVAGAVALVLVTLWIVVQGFRIITGQSHESMMGLLVRSIRVALIVSIATSMSLFGADLHGLFSDTLPTNLNQLFTGSDKTIPQSIDENLAKTVLAVAAIDAIQVPPDDVQSVSDKFRAADYAIFGTASPPMAAGAMLLMYSLASALFIGLGPLFILCLLLEKTRYLFEKWLLYGIGTLFSMAMLSFISSIVLHVTARAAGGLWATDFINSLTNSHSMGLTTQALIQGGIGLVLTALIIAVPPMAGRFFSATLGHFMPYSAFGGGMGSQHGPQGQPPAPGYAPPDTTSSASTPNPAVHAYRTAATPQSDTIKKLSEAKLAAAINSDPAYLTASVGAPAAGTGVAVPPRATTPDWAPLSPAAEHLRSEWASQQQLIQQGLHSSNPAAHTAALALQRDLHTQQMARLSDAVYDPNGRPPPGWTSVGNEPQALAAYGLKPDDFTVKGHHFGAQLYVPDPAVFGDTMKPVLAFRGTDIKNWDDIANDIVQGRNQYSADYKQAVYMGNRLLQSGKAGSIGSTGHSLGGGLAAAFALTSGAAATTLNAAGLNIHTVPRYGGTVHQTPIDAYHVEGEVLTSLQDNHHWLTDPGGAALSSMLPDAPGTTHPLPASSFDRISRHMMSDVIAGVDKTVEQDRAKLSGLLGNDW